MKVKLMGATVAVTNAENLGVTFDESVTHSDHVSEVVRQCTGILSGLSDSSRHYLPKASLVILVHI